MEKEDNDSIHDQQERLRLNSVNTHKNRARMKLTLELLSIESTIQPMLLDNIKTVQHQDEQCSKHLSNEINLNSNKHNHLVLIQQII